MLVEADPSGGSLLATCGELRARGDLYDVSLTRNSAGLESVAQPLGDLLVVPAWGRPFRLMQALVRPRVPWAVLFGEVDATVFVDVGRVYPQAPTMGLLVAADVVLLVAASEPGPVAATMEWANRGGCHGAGEIGVSADRLAMITSEVVGRRRAVTVTPRDLSAVTGATYLGHLPHDPDAVELLCRGGSVAHRSLRRSRMVEAATMLAWSLADPARVGVVR
jgi:hypothetical protein